MKKLFTSALGNLSACAIYFLLAYAIYLIWPTTKEGGIIFAITGSFCALSAWEIQNFGMKKRHYIEFFTIIILMAIIWLINIMCHIKWLGSHWQNTLIIILPLCALSLYVFICVLYESETERYLAC